MSRSLPRLEDDIAVTVFGWPVRVGDRSNPRFLRNFPMQANGAEMLRVACCLGTERRGIEICAPIHDAVLICAPLVLRNEAGLLGEGQIAIA
jgi:hypothetical protein